VLRRAPRAVCLAACLAGLGLSVPLVARAQAAPPASAAIQVQRYEVEGNTLLAAPLLQATLKPFEGQADLQRLKDAAAAVQDLYRTAGYGGVVAFLPEQTLGGGVVRIRVVEGRLVRVDVAENKQFSTANILASLPALQVGRTPQVRVIDAQIQIANENPAKTVQVLLQPGTEPGSVAAKLTVAEQPVQRWTARVDNTGGKRPGRWRAALGWQHANLFDADQVAGVELQTAPEEPSSVAVVSGSYRAPLYGQSAAIDVYGAYSDVDAGKIGTQAGDLQFSGKGTILGLRGNAYLPRIGNIDQRASLGLEWRDYLNNCAIAGLPAGACGSAGASVSVQPMSLGYAAQASGEVRWAFSVNLLRNLALGGHHGSAADFEAVRPGSKRGYTLLRSNGQFGLALAEWAGLAVRYAAQAGDRALVPGELFGIGGALSVRGFEERELGGDSGAQLTAELSGPNLGDKLGAELRPIVFADAGYVANRQGDPCLPGQSHCRIGSLGVGLRGNWPQAQLRLDLARAMSGATTTHKGDSRLHVGLTVNF
jgi:hemolysin activation/secretion protein